MNAPPFPSNPAVGQWFGNWVWNGVRWVCGPSTGVRVVTTVFTESGPYQPLPGLVTAVVECIGGGGAGGPAFNSQASASDILGGGGGGSGGYSRIALAAAIVAGGVNVTIGAGGVSGVSPAGDTSFGIFCIAHGGGAGVGNDVVTVHGDGGAEAPVGVGDVAFPGAGGFAGPQIAVAAFAGQTATGGIGGWTAAGGTQQIWVGPTQFRAGTNGYPGTGAGGGGAIVNQCPTTTPEQAGGTGGSGLCIVTEYCWADGSEDDCLNPPVNVNARVAVTQVPWTGPGPCPPGWGGGPYVGYDGE